MSRNPRGDLALLYLKALFGFTILGGAIGSVASGGDEMWSWLGAAVGAAAGLAAVGFGWGDGE